MGRQRRKGSVSGRISNGHALDSGPPLVHIEPMTDGNLISDRGQPYGDAHTIRAVEAAFRDLHELLRGAQLEVDHLDRAREAAVESALEVLGSEALWLEPEADVQFQWEPDSLSEFEARLKSETDGLKAALEEFLDGGDVPAPLPMTVRRMDRRTGEIQEWDVAESLRQIRAEFVRVKEERATRVRALRLELDESWRHTVDVLRAWVREPSRTAPEDWGRVQLAWRTALGLPGNRAAEILGVSAPAVTRYEKGSRSPSLAYIESMVERIVSHGAEPSQEASAAFGLADMFNVSTAELFGSLEASASREHEIREHITSLLDSLPIADVKVLGAIAASRDAISALCALSADDQLAPLRQVLRAIDRAGV